MALNNATDIINAIKALSKDNKRLFFKAFFDEQDDSLIPTQAEIDAQNLAQWNALKTEAGLLFNIAIPDSVTVSQIKSYMNNWIDNHAFGLTALVGAMPGFKQLQVLEADANGGTVASYLRQAVKIKTLYGFIPEGILAYTETKNIFNRVFDKFKEWVS